MTVKNPQEARGHFIVAVVPDEVANGEVVSCKGVTVPDPLN